MEKDIEIDTDIEIVMEIDTEIIRYRCRYR